MTELIEIVKDRVATLTLNRPESLNAITGELMQTLLESLQRLGADPSVGSIVLTGAGRAFCSGGDVKTMRDRSLMPFEERAAAAVQAGQIALLIPKLPKPVIALVNGPAVGAGLALACACDLRIAARSARFGAGFVKVGLSGDMGGTWTLPRLVGFPKARELYFTGCMIDSEEALRIGLVNIVADDASVGQRTADLARDIASMPRIALGYIKKNFEVAESADLRTAIESEAFHLTRCAQTEDHREAVAAFREKRSPVFKGQ